MKFCFGILKALLALSLTESSRIDAFQSSYKYRTTALSLNEYVNKIEATSPFSSQIPTTSKCESSPAFLSLKHSTSSISATALFAKKKGGPKGAAAAALAALEALEENEVEEEAMSKKDQMKAKKKKEKKEKVQAKKMDPKAAALAALDLDSLDEEDQGGLSKKEQMMAAKKAAKEAKKNKQKQKREEQQQQEQDTKEHNKKMRALKALEQMERDEAAAAAAAADDTPQLSKKEQKAALKAAKKKEEKLAAKKAKKEAAKAAAAGESGVIEGETDAVNGDGTEINGANTEQKVEEKKEITLEERIRKERPPPRIRVMESSQPDYSALRLEDVAITFRNQEVLKGVTWGVQTGDRVGLVGPNGGGKTTQLRILNGEMEPTSGDVVKSKKNLRVAMLRQEFVDELVPERTLKEEFLSVFEEENQILDDLKAAEKELEGMDPNDVDGMQVVLDKMQDIQAKADAKDVYTLESRAKKIMDLMGFTSEEAESKVRMFSGGWKMRIGLGKVLLNEPNILLLDEPTNHLDLESVEWLEDFLRNQNIPMVIVSHDREFLDQVCTRIVDTEGGIATEYDGNYSRFLKSKKARMDSWNAAYNAQEKKIKEERQWINKFRAKQPQAVKQRQDKLDKLMKSKDYVQKPPFVGKPFRFRFPDAPRLSPEVAKISNLSHAYVQSGISNSLFEDVDLFVEKNDRIAVLGPNGSGKSTLLRILMGMENSNEGKAEIIGQNVVANYFQQNQADALDLEKTVSETVQAASTNQSYNELRALLGQFLFKGDAVDKKVKNLSGGEKARLSLCCMMLRPANLLVLDEPTNHLDIPAKEMLEEALQNFEGSLMVISHDRFFISKVATTIVAIEDKKLNKYSGDYKFYMDKSKKMKEKIESRYVAGQRIGKAIVVDFEEMANKKKTKNFGGNKNASMVTRKDKGVKNAKRNKIK